MFPDWQTNTVFVSDRLPERFPDLFRSLAARLAEHAVPLHQVAGTADLWIRDYAPIQTAAFRFVRFRYRPDYLEGHEHLMTRPEVFDTLALPGTLVDADLVVDGGNVVASTTAALLTDKIYRENPDWSRDQTRRQLRDLLNVDRLVILPKEPYDPIGHVDGMLRLLDDRRIVGNDYREIDPPFATRLETAIEKAGFSLERLPYRPDLKSMSDIPPATGNYVNYLRIGDLVLVPAYGLPEDEIARARLADQLPGAAIFSLRCDELAADGGALNCVTWTVRLEQAST